MQAMQTAQAEPLAAVLYGVGAIALLALIAAALYRHKVSGAAPPSAARLVCAVSLVGLLYGADFCTSTASDFNFSGRYWVFFPLGTFFVAVMGLEAKAGRRVLEVLAFALALQCAYAVFAYFQGINQFHTPYFGSRTCGTFDNPNSLYPLGLFAVGLGMGLARAVEDRFSRCLFGGGALLGGAALMLTFTRAGWLALAVMLLYLGFSGLLSPSSPRRRTRWASLLAGGAAAGLLLATALVRTHGRIAGNPDDRSFWGRVAIWQTAWGIFRERPLLGHGFATYAEVQYRPPHLTPALRHYNPMNSEAKNFWLNLACEFGLAGLIVWGWLTVAYVRLYRWGCQRLGRGTPERAVFIGIHISLIGLMVAGLFDTPLLTRGREAATLMTFICMGVMGHLVSDPSHSEGEEKHEANSEQGYDDDGTAHRAGDGGAVDCPPHAGFFSRPRAGAPPQVPRPLAPDKFGD